MLSCPRAHASCLSEFFHRCGNPISAFHAFVNGAAEAGQPLISLSLWAGPHLRHSLWGLYMLVADSSLVFHYITITDHGTHRIPINS